MIHKSGEMKIPILTSLTSIFCAAVGPAFPQPEIHTIGLAITDLVEQGALPAHMRRQHPLFVEELHRQMTTLFEDLGRFQTFDWRASSNRHRYLFSGEESVDFVAHVIVHRLYRVYSNKIVYAGPFEAPTNLRFRSAGTQNVEVLSFPLVSGRIEVKLVDPLKDKIFWSGQRDSSSIVPHDEFRFIYNPSKYPGVTPPAMIQAYLADILRLQHSNPVVERALYASDRWYISEPEDDVKTARDVLADLVRSFYPELDGNLPLEGRIEAMLTKKKNGKPTYLLNIGSNHGLVPRLRLDVWRHTPTKEKMGQIEIVQLSPTSAIAKLRKLDRKIRKRGETLQPGDRVISRRRQSTLR